MSDRPPIKTILVLAANPTDTARLRIDVEVREIKNGLKRAQHRHLFRLEQSWAVRVEDIRRDMLEIRPQIVHFCGHGEVEGLAIEDENGQMRLVPAHALAEFFRLFQDHVECVVINACYSAQQADAIRQHINYVIGMHQGIGDRSAIDFAVGFYDALGAGRSYFEAYQFGCSALTWKGSANALTPQFLQRSQRPHSFPVPDEIATPAPTPDVSIAAARRPSPPTVAPSTLRQPQPVSRAANPLLKIPQSFVVPWAKISPFLFLLMLTWLIIGQLSQPESYDELPRPVILTLGFLGGALSGAWVGLASKRVTSTLSLNQIITGCIVSSVIGLIGWISLCYLFKGLLLAGANWVLGAIAGILACSFLVLTLNHHHTSA